MQLSPILTECSLPCSTPTHSEVTVENIMPPPSSSQQHGIFPSWDSERWIPQQSVEEVMTQEGVIAQLAVKLTADNPSFTFLQPQHRQEEICFPLSAGVNQGVNVKVLKIVRW